MTDNALQLEHDAENWVKFKLIGGKIKIKKEILPHKFIGQINFCLGSQLSDSDKKIQEEFRDKVEKAAKTDSRPRKKLKNVVYSVIYV